MATKSLSTTDWTLGDLLQDEGIAIRMWSLPEPEVRYSASAGCYCHHAGDGFLIFAQTAPSGHPLTAVGISMPRNAVRAFLGGLGTFGDRLEALERDRKLADVAPLDPTAIDALHGGEAYTQKRAELIRAATNDETSELSFYRIPQVPRQKAEASPREPFSIAGVATIELSSSTMRALILQMMSMEGPEPQGDSDAGENPRP